MNARSKHGVLRYVLVRRGPHDKVRNTLVHSTWRVLWFFKQSAVLD